RRSFAPVYGRIAERDVAAHLCDARRSQARSDVEVRRRSRESAHGKEAVTLAFPDCSDGELAALALAGRQAAFAELVRRHQSWVYRLAYSHVRDADEAVDLTQASFVAAFAALRRYDTARSFRAWFSR